MQAVSPWVALFFVAVIVVGSFLILQLFLAVLLENLGQVRSLAGRALQKRPLCSAGAPPGTPRPPFSLLSQLHDAPESDDESPNLLKLAAAAVISRDPSAILRHASAHQKKRRMSMRASRRASVMRLNALMSEPSGNLSLNDDKDREGGDDTAERIAAINAKLNSRPGTSPSSMAGGADSFLPPGAAGFAASRRSVPTGFGHGASANGQAEEDGSVDGRAGGKLPAPARFSAGVGNSRNKVHPEPPGARHAPALEPIPDGSGGDEQQQQRDSEPPASSGDGTAAGHKARPPPHPGAQPALTFLRDGFGSVTELQRSPFAMSGRLANAVSTGAPNGMTHGGMSPMPSSVVTGGRGVSSTVTNSIATTRFHQDSSLNGGAEYSNRGDGSSRPATRPRPPRASRNVGWDVAFADGGGAYVPPATTELRKPGQPDQSTGGWTDQSYSVSSVRGGGGKQSSVSFTTEGSGPSVSASMVQRAKSKLLVDAREQTETLMRKITLTLGEPQGPLQGRSLLLFGPDNWLRVRMHQLATSRPFDFTMTVLILASSVLLTLNTVEVTRDEPLGLALWVTDIVFTTAFGVEVRRPFVTVPAGPATQRAGRPTADRCCARCVPVRPRRRWSRSSRRGWRSPAQMPTCAAPGTCWTCLWWLSASSRSSWRCCCPSTSCGCRRSGPSGALRRGAATPHLLSARPAPVLCTLCAACWRPQGPEAAAHRHQAARHQGGVDRHHQGAAHAAQRRTDRVTFLLHPRREST